jgi:hypothetical protein
VFSPYAWAKLAYAAANEPTEVGAMAVTSKQNPLFVEDVCFVRQYASAAFVRLDDNAVADKSADLASSWGEFKLHPANFAYIFVHTHPRGMNRPSGHDEVTFSSKFGGYPWSVMFIMTKDLKTYCRLRINSDVPIEVEIPVSVDHLKQFPGSNWKEWDVELANVMPSSADPMNRVVPTKPAIPLTSANKLRAFDYAPPAPRPPVTATLRVIPPQGADGRFMGTEEAVTSQLSLLSFIPAHVLQFLRMTDALKWSELDSLKWKHALKALARVGLVVDRKPNGNAGVCYIVLPPYARRPGARHGHRVASAITTCLAANLGKMSADKLPPFAEEYARMEAAYLLHVGLTAGVDLSTTSPMGRTCTINNTVELVQHRWVTMEGKFVHLTYEEQSCLNHAKRTGLYDELAQHMNLLTGVSNAQQLLDLDPSDPDGLHKSIVDAISRLGPEEDEDEADETPTDVIYPYLSDDNQDEWGDQESSREFDKLLETTVVALEALERDHYAQSGMEREQYNRAELLHDLFNFMALVDFQYKLVRFPDRLELTSLYVKSRQSDSMDLPVYMVDWVRDYLKPVTQLYSALLRVDCEEADIYIDTLDMMDEVDYDIPSIKANLYRSRGPINKEDKLTTKEEDDKSTSETASEDADQTK